LTAMMESEAMKKQAPTTITHTLSEFSEINNHFVAWFMCLFFKLNRSDSANPDIELSLICSHIIEFLK
jgi:hypothetical protein